LDNEEYPDRETNLAKTILAHDLVLRRCAGLPHGNDFPQRGGYNAGAFAAIGSVRFPPSIPACSRIRFKPILTMSKFSGIEPGPRLTGTQWLICTIAAIGFAFDIYELLMMPLIAQPALAELLKVDPFTESGFQKILTWNAYIMWGSAICGGTFGLLGGYLTDRFGRRRVLTWSILLYAFSALAAGFSTSPLMLLVLRCTTFIGVCVEFVAAVAWLAELFPNPKQREAVLGYTQAFSSIGGLLVTLAFGLLNQYSHLLPSIHGVAEPAKLVWRYTLISGVIPALPLIFIRPFLPESPVWAEKTAKGTLRRPSIGELFAPSHLRTTLVTAFLFACSYGVAFGAIQLTPQIVPGLIPASAKIPAMRKNYEELKKAEPVDKEKVAAVGDELKKLSKAQQNTVKDVQLWQEFGGLIGRFVLAFLAMQIASRRTLLRIFQIPALLIIPLVFFFPAAGRTPEAILTALHTDNLMLLRIGIFLTGFLIVAQFSFWGNYLPLVYPVHLRGTGEGFAANVGGRMIGTAANALTALLLWPMFKSVTTGMKPPMFPPNSLAWAAGTTALIIVVVAFAASFVLPEPKPEEMEE
jgi:MFS family permease